MKLPRIMLAAPASGTGKTLITCGILQALVNRKLAIQSFKCGPDYIDPMFHTRVIGTPSRNLDPFFSDADTIRYLMMRQAQEFDLAVLEGVMGFYDGVAGTSFQASSYDLARITETPVVLVVNTRGMSRSVVPMIQGMVRYQADSHIAGVILNRMSPSIFPEIRDLVEAECGVKVIGYVPAVPDCVIESRHLGLVTPNDVADLKEKLMQLASILEDTLDLDALIELAKTAPDLALEAPAIPHLSAGKRVRIARAIDEAFCFYYEDNLDLLRRMGVELVDFSPLRDEKLPEDIQGLILAGGYPELYAQQLETNAPIREEIRQRLLAGLPSLAECGGFMFLHEEMEDMDSQAHPGAGVIKGRAYRTKKLGRFGYITLTANRPSVFGPEGTAFRAHEFHYFDSTSCGDGFHAKKPLRKRSWDCIHTEGQSIWGFPHLYYYSNVEAVWNFVQACAAYGEKEQTL